MTQRDQAIALAKQILDDRSDLGWLAPLAAEFMAVIAPPPAEPTPAEGEGGQR